MKKPKKQKWLVANREWRTCAVCGGSGKWFGKKNCPDCKGSGQVIETESYNKPLDADS
jgi:DnaJ-class molecular chaperone